MNRTALFTASMLLALHGSAESIAQRVRFPTAPPPLPAAPPNTFAAPPSTTSPFATLPVEAPLFSTTPAPPLISPSPYTSPYTPPPGYTAPLTTVPPGTAVPGNAIPSTAPPGTVFPNTTFPNTAFPNTAFPNTAAPIGPLPYTPPATFGPGSAAPAFPSTTAPFTSPTPPPGYPTTPYAAPSVGPPPTFDPYATGNPAGPPPAAVPYNYTPPPTNFPQQSAPLFPGGLPFTWQPGPTPSYQGDEGYYAKAQRFLQELTFEYTYLYGDQTEPDHLEINRAELSSTFAIPMFYNIDTPLLVTPGFAVNWLAGPMTGAPAMMMPTGPDMPSRIYDAYLDLAWYPKLTPWLGGELGVRTGVWSDFDHIDSDSVRFLGRGLASISFTPQLEFLFGIVYLDRMDVKFLPAGGVYWRPTPEWDAYLVFPNPKIRKYWATVGNSKWYWYFAGEYGGGSWSVQRQVNSDRIDINDIRVIGGIEWETQTLIRGFVEVGYVWDRKILFQSGLPFGEFLLDDTIMVRGGINF